MKRQRKRERLNHAHHFYANRDIYRADKFTNHSFHRHAIKYSVIVAFHYAVISCRRNFLKSFVELAKPRSAAHDDV